MIAIRKNKNKTMDELNDINRIMEIPTLITNYMRKGLKYEEILTMLADCYREKFQLETTDPEHKREFFFRDEFVSKHLSLPVIQEWCRSGFVEEYCQCVDCKCDCENGCNCECNRSNCFSCRCSVECNIDTCYCQGCENACSCNCRRDKYTYL